jgi:WD40 repeat protein
LAIGEKSTIRICTLATGEDSQRLKSTGYQAHYSKDGKMLASNDGGVIILWNAQTGEQIRSLPAADRTSRFVRFALAPDGRTVAALCRNRRASIRLYDAATGKERRDLQVADSAVRDMTISPDSNVLVVASQQMLYAWDVSSGKLLWEHHEYSNQLFCVAFSPDSKTLAAGLGGEVRRYDAATGQERPPLRDGERLAFVALIGDGRTVASAASGRPLRLWRLPNAEEILPDPGRKRPTAPIAADVSTDGKWMASRGHADGAIRVWDITSGKEIHRFPFTKSPACSFSPDGRWLQTHDYVQNPSSHTFEHELRFWDLRTGKMVSELKGDQASMPVFSPDSRLYATQGPPRGICCLVSVPDGSLVRTIPVSTGPCRFSFSADGRLLAGASLREDPPRLWEVATGQEITTLMGKAKPQTSSGWPGAIEAVFSPDGRKLVTGDYAGNLFCWDIEGRLIRQWKGDNFAVGYLRFSPDGKLLISGGNTTALIWNMREILPTEKRRTTSLTDTDLKSLWSDLKADDATRAWRAIWRLAAAPDQAIPFLRQRLRPAREPDQTNAARIAQLIGDLDDDAFAAREKARRELATFGREAEPALRRALASGPSVESKRRIEKLLQKLPESLPLPSPEQMRQLRALAVLEYAGMPEAKKCLKTLAGGIVEARLTGEAKAALERLAK